MKLIIETNIKLDSGANISLTAVQSSKIESFVRSVVFGGSQPANDTEASPKYRKHKKRKFGTKRWTPEEDQMIQNYLAIYKGAANGPEYRQAVRDVAAKLSRTAVAVNFRFVYGKGK